jgi:hypothetical protein
METAMPLTHDQRVRLVQALRWARAHKWKNGVWPSTRHNDEHWVYFDATTDLLTIPTKDAAVTVSSADEALDVLAALGILHPTLSPMINRFVEETVEPASAPPDAYAFDGPASFERAGEALEEMVNGRISAVRAAEVLSALAQQGLIASIEYVEQTTDELARFTDCGMSDPSDIADLAMVLSTGEYVPLDAREDD